MKRDKIIYWTTTGIVSAIMLWSAFNFSSNEEMQGAFVHLGLPGWFRIELTVAKILGVSAILIPMIPNRIKEFAYFGFALTRHFDCFVIVLSKNRECHIDVSGFFGPVFSGRSEGV